MAGKATGNPHALSIASPVVRRCTCKSPYQDQLYGPGMRLHNPKKTGAVGNDDWGYSCTVCKPDSKTRKLRSYANNHIKSAHG